MPVVDGFAVAEMVKKEKLTTKIAVITASVLDEDRERCRSLGIKYFLLKPFSMMHLKNIMEKLVKGSCKVRPVPPEKI